MKDPSDLVELIHTGGTLAAVWTIGGGVFCKVHTSDSEAEDEADNIRFVKEHFSQIPVPNVVHSWYDSDRSFLLVKRVQGDTLQNSWATLSPAQREKVAITVADMIDLLARQQSNLLRGVTGKPLQESYLSNQKSRLLGPLTSEACSSYFTATPNHTPPLAESFHFYHADLGPTNIMVSAESEVTGIIDWESAGFYPRFWIPTKPLVSPAFTFCPVLPGVDDHEWARQLARQLTSRNYPIVGSWFIEWMNIGKWRV